MSHEQVLKELREEIASLAADMRRPAPSALIPCALGMIVAMIAALVGYALFF